MGVHAIYFQNRRSINTRFVCVCVCFSSPSLARCPGTNMAEADSCRLFTTGRYRSCTADIAGWSILFFFLSVEEIKRARIEGYLLWQHTADGQRNTGVCMKVHFFKIQHRTFPLYNSPSIFSIVFPVYPFSFFFPFRTAVLLFPAIILVLFFFSFHRQHNGVFFVRFLFFALTASLSRGRLRPYSSI